MAENEFPTSNDWEDVYEQQFEDELELMRESQLHSEGNLLRKEVNPVRRSLDFSSPATKDKIQPTDTALTEAIQVQGPGREREKRSRTLEFPQHDRNGYGASSPLRKRHKPEPGPPSLPVDEDELLIQRILAGRRARGAVAGAARGAAAAETVSHLYNVAQNMSYDIPRWNFMGVTRTDGMRVYVRLEGAQGTGEDTAITEWKHPRLVYTRAWEEARHILKEKREATSLSQHTADVETPSRAHKESALPWATRHRPHSYLHLLTAEPDNRAALHWLKLWDKVVFNREVKTKEQPKANSFNKRTGAWEGRRRGARAGVGEEESELDESGRPLHRVLLLCGPPGAGKTTLAHLLATHAGYRPLEMNASDDRSVEVFRTTLHSATEMQATLHADKRPNCLILDEIDGAPLPTVEFLAKFVSGSGEGGGGKKGKGHVLRRPIICICNDVWAPALRPLRAVARVVHVSGVTGARLAERLGEICQREGVSAEPAALLALAERSAGDVRTALTTIQFLARHGQMRLTDVARLEANALKGEAGVGVVMVLRQILCDGMMDSRVLLHNISNLGDYDKLSEGVLENYAKCATRTCAAAGAAGALADLDRLQAHVHSTHNYTLYPHLPLPLLRCRRLLANKQTHTFIKFPTKGQEVRGERARTTAVVETVRTAAAAQLRPHATTLALTLDLLPLLPHILAPNLRSHNVQIQNFTICAKMAADTPVKENIVRKPTFKPLYGAGEREAVAGVARVMCDYGLAYEQTRAQDNTYHYTLQPDILRVATFSGGDGAGSGVRKLTYALQQTLAREVQLEMMRRAEIKPLRPDHREAAAATKPAVPRAAPSLPNHLQRLQPKKIELPSVATHKDFFGRVVAGAAAGANKFGKTGGAGASRGDGDGGSAVSRSSIYYHYREGFNNAVRRSVKMRDLM